MSRGEAAAGNDERNVSIGQRDRDAGTDSRALSGLEYARLRGDEIGTRITRVGVKRHRRRWHDRAHRGEKYIDKVRHCLRLVQFI